MSDRDRKKIRAERLLQLILELENVEKDNKYTDLEKRIAALEQGYTYIKQETVNNTATLQNIKNDDQQNAHVTQASAKNIQNIKEMEMEMEMMKQINHNNN